MLIGRNEQMADIDVVPSKRGTNLWIWIIVAIVLVLIVLSAMGVFSGDLKTTGGGSLTSVRAALSR
jgi:flagellar basal body-associated protein FliL